ncbi:methyl-accepting chemotaxis protein [Paenibacillus baekrokdamisoli]|uniref:Methyl-accepting chemotaxis protein n=1 Tax=Paenibacillus baekrokdamisoli TaxID=1712516 RepID=A0A3G9J8F1_9BACL|nr:methyl-accepting chemotaxis protein [Paenibacillus baekrokdamisoli]MBB3067496.1 methyl-accepting chemotaxis protein [Paenibacillus baekrokdamisoli]BBH19319.1 methyl-accepting chemotaxis protein [Paenibacillus baekrokdamisoli]
MSSNKKAENNVPEKDSKNIKSLYSNSVQAIGGMKLKSPFKSVGTMLFLIIFSAILVCVLVVGLFSYSTSKSIIKKKVSESDTVAISQSQGKLDLMFGNYDALTMQILLDKNIQENLQKYAGTKEDYDKFDALKKVSETIQTYILGNSSIVGAAVVPIKGDDNTVTIGGTNIRTAEAQKSDWMKSVVAASGRVVWLPSKEKGYSGTLSEPTVALGRVMKNAITNEATSIVVVEIYLKEIAKQLEDLKLGAGSDISIVDSNNKIIFSSLPGKLGNDSVVKLTNGKDMLPKASETVNQDGNQILAVYSKIDSTNWYLLGTVPVAELVKDAAQIRDITWIIAAIAALLAIGIGLLVIRMVAMPLIRLKNLMTEGEQGNLSVRSKVKSKDEIGQLSQSFNQMMAQITQLVTQTNQSAQDVLSTAGELTDASKKTAISAKEIAVATEEIANGASSLAIEADKGSDLTQEIGDQMQQVMSANEEMGVAASEVERASMQGTAYMNSLIEKTGLTEEMTRSMVEKVDRLKESTRSIRKILDLLSNVSKQTNILSLNATIEAARAGAAGKGFMVVADEIRKLADQSRQSIEIVGQITDTIQREIDETVNVLSTAYPIFQEQISSVKEANQIFLTVQSQMGDFVGRLSTVTNSISGLERSQVVLSEAMSNVSAVAEESSATSEQVASLSSEQTSIGEGLVRLSDKLEMVSKGLKETLSRFRT